MFIHGIGIGLYPYINFLADLNAEDDGDPSGGQIGIIAVELMPISSRITAEAMLKDEMCEEICCILKAHGWERLTLASHSWVHPLLLSVYCLWISPYTNLASRYGSVVATHLLHTPQIATKIGPILFVDPVSFLLHLPDVAYNFVNPSYLFTKYLS